jgi:GNAT superfamily N-acetyltransferase
MLVAQKISVRRMTAEDRPLLDEMYSRFSPQAGVLGLPPADAGKRREWLDNLARGVNFVAFAGGSLAGHMALLPDNGGAEMVCFVHQDFRRQGVATALGEAALAEAHRAGWNAIWVLVDNYNAAAWRGLLKFGFHAAWQDRVESKFIYPIGERL